MPDIEALRFTNCQIGMLHVQSKRDPFMPDLRFLHGCTQAFALNKTR